MDPVTIPIIVVGTVLAVLAFFAKRLLDELKELKQDVRNLQNAQAEEKNERTRLSGQIDGLKIGADNLADKIKDLKERL